jgi:dolichol-phosphate mannosyltransferase
MIILKTIPYSVLEQLAQKYPSLKYETNLGPNGFGYAVRYGLERFSGDCVAIMMADLSDSPYDLIRYYTTMMEGNYDCVFGSRFIKGGKVIDYPLGKKNNQSHCQFYYSNGHANSIQ